MPVPRLMPQSEHPISFQEEIRPIKTVCIFLGPYRNLTTFSAALMSLHPNSQVLNHAAERVFGKESIDFFKNPSQEIFTNFLSFAILESLQGQRENYGGAIFLAHAYDSEKMRSAYNSAYDSWLKEKIECLVWKDSHAILNYIRKEQIDMESLLHFQQQIKFVLPIRHPLDCIKSNLKMNMIHHFNAPSTKYEDLLEVLFEDYLFFLKLQKKYPNHFFTIFQNRYLDQIEELRQFLELTPSKKWLGMVHSVFSINKKAPPKRDLLRMCQQLIDAKFVEFPHFQKELSLLVSRQ